MTPEEQIDQLTRELANVKRVLTSLIAWSAETLGVGNAKILLSALNDKDQLNY